MFLQDITIICDEVWGMALLADKMLDANCTYNFYMPYNLLEEYQDET